MKLPVENRLNFLEYLRSNIFIFEWFLNVLIAGKGFLEIHHQKPMFMLGDHEYDRALITALANVIPVCSNCHRMVHKAKMPLLVEEVKTKINQKLYFCV